MSTARMKNPDDLEQMYLEQNSMQGLTMRQQRAVRKSRTRYAHQEQRSIHRERKRNRRQQLRDWLKGIKG